MGVGRGTVALQSGRGAELRDMGQQDRLLAHGWGVWDEINGL